MHYKQYTIIFNGEIYNHLELRKYITEFKFIQILILKLCYISMLSINKTCLIYLDGMYALVIYDNVNHSLIVARDRSGKKPLYYYANGDNFVFASELNIIKPLVKLEIMKMQFILF